LRFAGLEKSMSGSFLNFGMDILVPFEI
jgi:hypothetical protein